MKSLPNLILRVILRVIPRVLPRVISRTGRTGVKSIHRTLFILISLGRIVIKHSVASCSSRLKKFVENYDLNLQPST